MHGRWRALSGVAASRRFAARTPSRPKRRLDVAIPSARAGDPRAAGRRASPRHGDSFREARGLARLPACASQGLSGTRRSLRSLPQPSRAVRSASENRPRGLGPEGPLGEPNAPRSGRKVTMAAGEASGLIACREQRAREGAARAGEPRTRRSGSGRSSGGGPTERRAPTARRRKKTVARRLCLTLDRPVCRLLHSEPINAPLEASHCHVDPPDGQDRGPARLGCRRAIGARLSAFYEGTNSGCMTLS